LIGDVVFTTPAIHALRRRFPSARLLYLVESGAAPVVTGNPYVSDVIVVPHTRGWRRLVDDWRLAARLRREQIDVAIDFHGGPRSGWLTWASRARVRVGYDVAGRTWCYTKTVHRPRGLHPRHSVVNQWDLLGAVGATLGAPPTPEADRVEMTVDAHARASVDARLAAIGVPAHARVVLVHVSAGNPFRRWPESAFAELAASLVTAAPDRWVLLTGGPSDRDAAARVLTDAKARAGVDGARVHVVEDWSLAELRAACDRAALYIGGDSGPLHIAATSDVPVVGLYGPTLPERSAPWRPAAIPTASVDMGALPCRPCDQRACAPGDFRCLTGITAARVAAEAERLLEMTR
jgi:lipopolysaccharide heptosyltransferase II